MLNRSAVSLRPAQPFIDWVATLEGPTAVPSLDDEPTVYLVPPFDDDEQGREILVEAFPVLFERELYGWWTDEARWPPDRDLAMFHAWFQVELLPVLEDVCEGPIVDESEVED